MCIFPARRGRRRHALLGRLANQDTVEPGRPLVASLAQRKTWNNGVQDIQPVDLSPWLRQNKIQGTGANCAVP
jgi:hypothetical protein